MTSNRHQEGGGIPIKVLQGDLKMKINLRPENETNPHAGVAIPTKVHPGTVDPSVGIRVLRPEIALRRREKVAGARHHPANPLRHHQRTNPSQPRR